MNLLSKVEDKPNLVRDEKTRAVLNTDKRALDQYKAQKARNKELDNLKNDVDSIRDDMVQLKFMMSKILEKLDD